MKKHLQNVPESWKIVKARGDMRDAQEEWILDQTKREILFLDPVCTHNIWGGSRLREEFGYPEAGSDIGECWGISAHPNGDGTVKYGALAGKKLSEVWREHRELFGDFPSERMPIMAKLIDAREDLSIQVHPDDVYAAEHENGAFGKRESWYVIDAPDGATLVAGHNATTREELSAMIHEGRWAELIREIPVKKGDFIQIDPGTVHAIKAGILLMEMQQSSDITYRVYDYDRCAGGKRRELHVEKSIDVITVPAKPVEDSVFSALGLPANRLNELYRCEDYTVFRIDADGEMCFEQVYPFLFFSVTEGEGTVNGLPVKKGDHMILPCGYGSVCVRGRLEVIAATVGRPS